MYAMLWYMDKCCQTISGSIIPGSVIPGSIIHIVDGDVSVRDGMRTLLQGMTDSIHTYPDAETFLAGLPIPASPNVGPPDAGPPLDAPACLIVEINLPGMSGLELLERLHEWEIHMPVIMLASFSDVPTAVRAMRAGAMDFIDKPFVDRILRARVRQALSCADVPA